MTDVPPADGIALRQTIGERLEAFRRSNPSSSIEIIDGENVLYVEKPWGDSSLIIELPEDESGLFDALNSVILPERFSALFHIDTNELEIIYTALSLVGPFSDLRSRVFHFLFNDVEHWCRFASSSERLLKIAKYVIPVRSSETTFRNLQSYTTYLNSDEDTKKTMSPTGPTSFWISSVDYSNLDNLENLISNLNFYMRYYDDASPIVLVHDISEQKMIPRNRYITGKFPERIKGRQLDSNLLSFWNFTGRNPNQNPMINFILYYRIIEYAAYHYVDSVVRTEIRKILMAPSFDACALATVENIVGTINISKLEEVSRFRAVIQHCITSDLLWTDVETNREFFSDEAVFDGGFRARPLIGRNETIETFRSGRLLNFADSIRKIRNTLSHGKDQETAGVITPTLRNFKLLRPWLHLIATAAGEVVLHKDVT